MRASLLTSSTFCLRENSENWDLDEQTAQQFRKRLGNMVLLNPDENVKLSNKGFAEKKIVYSKSPLLLTQKVAQFTAWGPAQIDEWQEQLAGLAVQMWPEK